MEGHQKDAKPEDWKHVEHPWAAYVETKVCRHVVEIKVAMWSRLR